MQSCEKHEQPVCHNGSGLLIVVVLYILLAIILSSGLTGC